MGDYKSGLIQTFEDTYRKITQRRVHPNYNSVTFDYDYLVMKLNSRVSQTPIVLNTNASIPTTNEVLTVIGFGVTSSGGSTPSTLMKVNVNYVDSTTCSQDLGEPISSTVKLCAGVPGGGKDSCQGDSGGPIMDANHVQVGIVSYGVGCGQASQPGVYSRVNGATDWINQQICELSSNPPSTCKNGSSPTSAPASSPTSKPLSCFSEENTVEVERKGIVLIANLQIGDKVKDANGKMVTVYSFGHFQKNIKAEYLRIHAKELHRPLEISKDHLLFVNGAAIPASTVQLGDRIDLGHSKGNAQVNRIHVVTRSAAYAPFTTSGTIMVSGVAASSYVTLQSGSSVLEVGEYKTSLSMHWLSHVFQAPHRLICECNIGLCKAETYNTVGISRWLEGPFYFGTIILEQEGTVMVAMLAPFLLFGLLLHLLEVVFSHASVAFVGLLLLGFARAKRRKSKVA